MLGREDDDLRADRRSLFRQAVHQHGAVARSVMRIARVRCGAVRTGGAPPERAPAAPSPGQALTAREREVAALVARGLSNGAIAAALVVEPGTAANHVHHILAKLGCANRAALAARWAAASVSRRI